MPLAEHLWHLARLRHLPQRSATVAAFRRWLGPRFPDADYLRLADEVSRVGWRIRLAERRGTAPVLRGGEHLCSGAVLAHPHVGSRALLQQALAAAGHPLVLSESPGPLPEDTARAALERGQLVGALFDGRAGGQDWLTVPWLGHTATLYAEPWALAFAAQVPVIPAFTHVPRTGPLIVLIAAPIAPGDDEAALAAAVLAVQEVWLRRWPESYGRWLTHALHTTPPLLR